MTAAAARVASKVPTTRATYNPTAMSRLLASAAVAPEHDVYGLNLDLKVAELCPRSATAADEVCQRPHSFRGEQQGDLHAVEGASDHLRGLGAPRLRSVGERVSDGLAAEPGQLDAWQLAGCMLG